MPSGEPGICRMRFRRIDSLQNLPFPHREKIPDLLNETRWGNPGWMTKPKDNLEGRNYVSATWNHGCQVIGAQERERPTTLRYTLTVGMRKMNKIRNKRVYRQQRKSNSGKRRRRVL